MRHLLPLASLFLACGAAAQVGTATYYPPTEWPALERIAQKVPAFAGFTVSQQQGTFVVLPALTDPSQETALRSTLNADPYWKKQLTGWSMGQGAVRMKTPIGRLLEVARKVQKERPNATLRIDTAFGKVRLNAPDAFTRTLAAKLGVVGLLVNNEWKPPLTVSYDVQPRVVSLKSVGDDDLHAIPALRVTVTNMDDEVAELPLYCSTLPVRIVTARGEGTPSNSLACPDILQTRLIQPGETINFDTFSFSKVKKLKPGRYAWILQLEPRARNFPFTLTK